MKEYKHRMREKAESAVVKRSQDCEYIHHAEEPIPAGIRYISGEGIEIDT